MTPHASHDRLLRGLGERVRALRQGRGLSRRDLARSSGLSERFLAALESGAGNISVGRLAELASALGTGAGTLLQQAEGQAEAREDAVVALLGLRGAGKSSVGRALAHRRGVRFVELDELVEATAGMGLAQIFEDHGERHFRRLEREALLRFLADNPRGVLAAGGGLVTEPATWDLLRRHATTVWLKARPREHWDRVVAQGDRRPMANRAAATDELKAILETREPLYARADLHVDTSGLSLEQVVDRVAGALEPALPAD